MKKNRFIQFGGTIINPNEVAYVNINDKDNAAEITFRNNHVQQKLKFDKLELAIEFVRKIYEAGEWK